MYIFTSDQLLISDHIEYRQQNQKNLKILKNYRCEKMPVHSIIYIPRYNYNFIVRVRLRFLSFVFNDCFTALMRKASRDI